MAYRAQKYRDLEKLKVTRTNYNRNYYQGTAVFPRRKWTDEEIELLFRDEITDRELSAKIGRSMKAIVCMRCRIRKELEGNG